MTRVENQKILTDLTYFNLSEQIRTSILLLENKWEKKNINFKLDIGEYIIEANEELLKQVWINLIDNAIKFTDEDGNVEINIRESEKIIDVSIVNYGVEIPSEKIDKIFRKFYQADESHSTQGNGIGLAVVKRVVELHNGNITVESSDRRTCFKVSFYKS